MSKNHRIEARVSIEIKNALERKAEAYGGITRFLEELARKDIILVDKNISSILKSLRGGKINARP